MEPLHPLAGIYAAAITPLENDGYTPDPESAIAYLAFLAERGCHGALLFGTTGEGPSFSTQEKISFFQSAVAVRQEYPKFRLLAGTGTPSLIETITLNQAAFDAGFDGVVTLPPFYFRSASEDGLLQWFDRVIQESVPAGRYLLGYHIPKVSGVSLPLALLNRLKDTHPDKFAGIKDSSHDLQHAKALGQHFGRELLVLTGTDSYLHDALNYNAQGAITAPANIISPEMRAFWDARLENRNTADMQEKITSIREILENYMPFPPILKALAAELHDFPLWGVRPPLENAPLHIVKKATVEIQEALHNTNV